MDGSPPDIFTYSPYPLFAGFIPEGNPHETIELFSDLEAALDWHHSSLGSGALPEEDARRVYGSALAAALKDREAAAAATKAVPEPPPSVPGPDGAKEPPAAAAPEPTDAQKRDAARILLHAGGRVDPALITAFSLVSGSDALAAGQAASQRCRELLTAMPSSLLQDVATLWADAAAGGDEEGAARQLAVLQHYRQEMQRRGFSPVIATSAAGPSPALPKSSFGLPPSAGMPMEAFAWQTYLSAPPGGLIPPEQSSLVTEDGSAADGDPAAAAGTAASIAAGTAVGTAAGTAGVVGSLSSARRLMLQYRVQKKMVLWDAVLAAAWAASKSSEAEA